MSWNISNILHRWDSGGFTAASGESAIPSASSMRTTTDIKLGGSLSALKGGKV